MNGNVLAFDEYVEQRGPALLRLAFVLTGDRYLAQDLAQSALIKAHQKWRRVRTTDQPDAYVRRVLVNEHLSWRRRRSSGEIPVDRAAEDYGASGTSGVSGTSAGQPDAAARLAERDSAWRLLATLPPKQRAVLVLRYYEDLPDAEIAAVLGCGVSTVRSQASRALATLRDSPLLAEFDPPPFFPRPGDSLQEA